VEVYDYNMLNFAGRSYEDGSLLYFYQRKRKKKKEREVERITK
jgi:hypothetical protein